MIIVFFVGLLLLAVFVYYLFSILEDGADKAHIELLKICRGDEAMLERLVSREQKRAPNINYATAVKRAIESYRRDQ